MGTSVTFGLDRVAFGVFEADLEAVELRKNGARVKLEGQPFQILALLLEHPGQVITREELQQKLWPADTFVDFEHSINTAVKKLREALGDSADSPRFIETLPRRGYRFICPVGISNHNERHIPPTAEERRRPALSIVSLTVLLILFLALSTTPVRERGLRAGTANGAVAHSDSGPSNGESYQLYVKGRHLWGRRNREDLLNSLDYFSQMIQADPGSVWGYVGQADTYAILGNNSFLPAADTYPKAEAAAKKALELDGRVAEAHATLGLLLFHYHWDRQGAERELRRAIELDSQYAVAYLYYSSILSLSGRHDEALVQIHFALSLEPASVRINEKLGQDLYYARKYDRAIEALKKAVELEPTRPRGLYDRLGWAYLANGQTQQAIETLEKAVQLSGRDSLSLAGLGHAYGVTGRNAEARKILDELRRKQTYVSPELLSWVYLGLGQQEECLKQLEHGLAIRDSTMSRINVDPRFDPLRNNPRFERIRRDMGF